MKCTIQLLGYPHDYGNRYGVTQTLGGPKVKSDAPSSSKWKVWKTMVLGMPHDLGNPQISGQKFWASQNPLPFSEPIYKKKWVHQPLPPLRAYKFIILAIYIYICTVSTLRSSNMATKEEKKCRCFSQRTQPPWLVRGCSIHFPMGFPMIVLFHLSIYHLVIE